MHRISERLFQAKKDLETCEERIGVLGRAETRLRTCGLARTAAALGEEVDYWKLRAESAKAMIAVETVGEW